jgi:hypothetical protein
MRKFWIATAAYVTIVASVIAGAAAAFNTVVGLPSKGAANQDVTQMGPIQRASGKWTPVEIKREPPASSAPPLPPYVSPRLTVTANANTHSVKTQMVKQRQIGGTAGKTAARKSTNKVIAARRGYDRSERQVLASYAAPEPRCSLTYQVMTWPA